MRGYIKKLIIFIFLLLALFIQPSNIFACDYIGQNSSTQYYISSAKSETHFVNNNKEENYVAIKNNNRTEILNLSSKNQHFGFGNLDKASANFIDSNNSIIDNSKYPTSISQNISPNLKNAIYARAP